LNIGDLESMNKIKIWIPVIFYITAIIIGMLITWDEKSEQSILQTFYNSLDTSSAVALAILAGFAYWQYAKEQNKQYKYLKELDKAKNTEGKDGAVLIKFGGKKNVMLDMKKYAKETLNLPEELIISKEFGDENGQINKEDIKNLEEFLEKEVMQKLTYVDTIHLFYGVVGVGAYVCADILNNWKSIKVYHYNAEYELWYIDRKHRSKSAKTLKEI